MPEGGYGGYLHFGIDDEWVINYDEGILMNKISNYHDIEGGPYLKVFILIHNNEKYVAHTFKYCDITDRVYIRYIVTICGKKIDKINEKNKLDKDKSSNRYCIIDYCLFYIISYYIEKCKCTKNSNGY